MNKRPKYSIPEIERRWTVDDDALPDLGSLPKAEISDKYLTGTRLRLRSIQNEDGAQYKIGKKYGDIRRFSESITNIYLSPVEYEILNRSEGIEVSKTRYKIEGGSLDVFTDGSRPMIFSVEFAGEDEAISYEPPHFVVDEVTNDQGYSGVALARRKD
jgi:CYTH domain-containing protein